MKRKCYTYRLSVTRVLVSFLQRFNADSNRSGSSLRNFSARTTISISELNRPFIPSCKLGNRTFRSATVLLKYSVYYNQQFFRLYFFSIQKSFLFFLLLPRFAHYQGHILHIRHVHSSLSIYDIATQFLHRVFQLAATIEGQMLVYVQSIYISGRK